MAEPITVDNGDLTNYNVLVDDVVDGTLGSGAKQLVSLVDGLIGSTTKILAGGGVEAAALRVTIASDSTGVVSIDDNGASITVDGPVTDAQLRATAVPVSGTVAVTGVATDAKLDTVIGHLDGVEGILTTIDADTGAIMTAVQVLDNAISGTEMQVDVVAALPAGTNNIGDVDVLSLPALPAGTNNIGDVDVLSMPTVTVNAHAVTNAGTFATQVDGAALTALQLLDDTVFTDDNAFTPGTSKVLGVGAQADEATTDSVDEGDIGALRMTLNRLLRVAVTPATAGGWNFVKDIDFDETETAVKATAGQLGGWYLYNDGAAEVCVKFYNATTANVTVGTTVPDFTIVIPAGSGANVEWTNGIEFSTAITVAATTLIADNDATAPTANQVSGVILYK